MNAIIISALMGVVMMFSSWLTDAAKTQRNIGLAGMLLLIVANIAQLNGAWSIQFDTKDMLVLTALACMLIYYCSY